MGKSFASDNNSGVHPAILRAIGDANTGHEIAYGGDPYTEGAAEAIRDCLGREASVFFVFGGTGANVLGLAQIARPHHSVICAETSHIHRDECGAPERFAGCKLLAVPSPDGKLTVEGIQAHLTGIGFEHHAQPRVVSITQATEYGTVYRPDEIRRIANFAHDNGLLLHMDGARLCNAAAFLDADLREITGAAGVDVLSFGGTKNGMLFGESVVFFNPFLAADFKYVRKQGMQLFSKMRFVAAQYTAFLRDGLWREMASHANRMARLLAEKVRDIPGADITQPVETNAVFATVPRQAIPALQKHSFFYVWDERRSEVRWMASFDTESAEVEAFADHVLKVLGQISTSPSGRVGQ